MQLEELQDSGYILPENDDHEVAIAINAAAHNMAQYTLNVMRAKEYIYLDGKFYAKTAIKQIASKEMKS
jgi:hypothetical protein